MDSPTPTTETTKAWMKSYVPPNMTSGILHTKPPTPRIYHAIPAAKNLAAIPVYLTTTATMAKVWNSEVVRNAVTEARAHLDDCVEDTGPIRDIYKATTPESCCEMVQLVSWFNDGGCSESITWNITKRGKKILPELTFGLFHPNAVLSADDEKLRKEIIQECITAITKGKVIGYDE